MGRPLIYGASLAMLGVSVAMAANAFVAIPPGGIKLYMLHKFGKPDDPETIAMKRQLEREVGAYVKEQQARELREQTSLSSLRQLPHLLPLPSQQQQQQQQKPPPPPSS